MAAIARPTAGWAALGLGLSALMAALGAGMGTKKKIWPPQGAAPSR